MLRFLLALISVAATALPTALPAQPIGSLDLLNTPPAGGLYRRVLGSVGLGDRGVPVAGGHDVDSDGFTDYALAAMQADPDGRTQAGQVFLVFGDGTTSGQLDTVDVSASILRIIGDQVQENAGSEIWMDDLTGDGLGDLVICRQNFSLPDRIGAGAVTILPGGQALRALAENTTVLDLRSPPQGLPVVTLIGATAPSRLCMWARAGDVTGDGIADLAVGADREASNGELNSGAVYLLRGGSHWGIGQTIDLADFGTVQPGNILRIRPRVDSAGFDFGATVQVADLDSNGAAEVLAVTALNRSGGTLEPLGGTSRGNGGSTDGTVYILWDDNFGGDWDPAPDFIVDAGPGALTVIDGATANEEFGEELLGGLDYDNDGDADLFVGDLTANGWGAISDRTNAGTSHVIYDIALHKGAEFDLDAPPQGLVMATFVGPIAGAISGDTALHGDFNADGIDDLGIGSPSDDPLGRNGAGTVHIVLGRNGPWPALSDLAPANFPESGVSIFEIYGAEAGPPSIGDMLCYSAAGGDIDGDGVADLIFNEMGGDGSATDDVGNLLLMSGARLFGLDRVFQNGFEDPPPQGLSH
jgi:FG-GAP repeat